MTRHRRWTALLLTAASLTAACGDDTTLNPSAPAATSGSPRAEPTTTAADLGADDGVDVDVGPSVLDLLEGRGSHGTFTVMLPAAEAGGPRTYTGRYVRTASGGTYTVADMDLTLVQSEVRRLLAMEDRFTHLDPIFADAVLSADTVVTDQLQVGLADLLLRRGFLGHEGLIAMEPSLVFTVLESNPLEPCEAALEALRSAVEQRVADEASELGPGWEPDADRLGAGEREAAINACDGLEEVDTTQIGLEIDDVRVSVVVDSGEELVSIAVQPGVGEVLTIEAPNPAPLLDRFGPFFLAIDRCGGLPWLYSNFAAANSYTSPDEGGYIGPTPFDGAPLCADEVPADQRVR